jgi:hypothetical protein
MKKADLTTYSILDRIYKESKKEKDGLLRSIDGISDELKKTGLSIDEKKIWQKGLRDREDKLAQMPSPEIHKKCRDIVEKRIILAKARGRSKPLTRKEIRNKITDKGGKAIPERTFYNKMKAGWEKRYFESGPGNTLVFKNGALQAILKEYKKK